MRNNRIILPLLLVLLLTSCNMPSDHKKQAEPTQVSRIWNLDNFQGSVSEKPAEPVTQAIRPTSTPQLVKAVDFESAFNRPADIPVSAGTNRISGGNDEAQWLFFDPAEYSSTPAEFLYAVFTNSGSSVWTEDYSLEFFAGVNPCKNDKVSLNSVVQPGERGTFRIPISSPDPSWKACWQIKNAAGESFYEFCYNHGSGQNNSYTNFQADVSHSSGDPNVVDVAAGVAGKEGYFAFQRTEGSAPAKYSSDELSAELLSTSPASGHTFKAYDHFESLSVTFQNNGSTAWDNSYSLKFYSGYNWFHETSFSIGETVNSGESTTITMPMEIIEDNDKWFTCWYLSSPDGKNLSDFCFNYYTKG